ncbi:preprotein translocase subunit SecA [Flavilitoribacter nigricans DSM 23189 = NBRC 102662]|uniref:Protein translocase subunit SecA n=1 Tax=Flavilitoribacter nigricans (strain ATCC 23147 / DSM 23189 / NBRC 102662 / NCIMB 1420 / SS-2) TaxID=1122177 RepID=A0A2D0N6A0_FLAN2|nr:preprotein translocase subunit SecA [Flavilitoribacter nigricans DSM 23189 = NBRC 102662]
MTDSVKKIFGSKYERDVKNYMPIVDEINEIYETLGSLSNDELRNKSLEFRSRIADHLAGIDEDIQNLRDQAEEEENLIQKESYFSEIDNLIKERDTHLEDILKEILPEAFAVVKETARRFSENETIAVTATDHDRELAARTGKGAYIKIEGDQAIYHNSWVAAGGEITWNMVHYDVQLIGGMVLHDGKIAEMATGEGKTLVATLPAYLNGLSGKGVHVITVNDYLARRDSEWVGPLFEFLFLTIDCIDKYRPHSPDRINAYKCDITYGTNNEFGFDYLRDNMVRSMEEKVQGKHHFAMIDEVDSVLIDDARTPLIISGPVPQGSEDQEYNELKPHIERLVSAQRKMVQEYLAEAKKLFKEGNTGLQDGEGGMALLRAFHGLPKYRPLIKFLSEEGVKVTLQKTENHYMQEQSKNMHLVDDPLYFIIDEKNRSVELTDNGAEYLAKFNEDSQFFIMPDIATNMVAIDNNEELTAKEKEEAKNKLAQDFAVKSKRLHSISQLLKAYTMFERDEEYVVMDNQVKIVDEQTGRMMEGRRYSDGLHQALEAKENVKVGDITQTYATVTLQNYFRMYHKLAGMTGTAETEASELWDIYKLDVVVIPTNKPIIRDDREDLVYKTEREKFNAVIDEIVSMSEAGRPTLVGTTSVDISEKLSRMLQIRGIDHNILNAKQHQREAEIVAEAGKPGNVTIATNMAGRGTDIKISDQVKAAGGLAIIGTERHDSRRIDRQLRGRAGRQGDPGSSQFYVSLEDKLMRLFQTERIAGLMDRMGHQEGEVIQHRMVSKSIERAQKKVEENNFGIRKRLLEYDDVMNIQREAIYKKRDNALSGDRLSVDLNHMFESMIDNLVYEHKMNGDAETFRRAALSILGFDPQIEAADFKEGATEDVSDRIYDQFREFYDRKSQAITDVLMPQVQHVYENQGQRYKRIVLPFTDGSSHPLPVTADIADAVKTKGKSIVRDIEKAVTLAIIDEKWKEHLRSMDELKESVQAASFEQKDPLVVYKMEAFNLFEQLVFDVNESVTSYLAKGSLPATPEQEELRQAREQRTDMSKVSTNRTGEAARQAGEAVSRKRAKPETFKRTEKKVGRNDPCPCGSGKKYKQCHGR